MRVISFIVILVISSPGYSRSTVLQQSLWATAAAFAGIHAHTLYSIALQESGQQWKDGTFRPWPWTLHVNSGKSGIKAGAHRYPSREAAETALHNMLGLGLNNVDVGLMQINIVWHGDKVKDAVQLLDPRINLTVAATILKNVHAGANVTQTIARYHSFNPQRGLVYANQVKHYEKILHDRFQ